MNNQCTVHRELALMLEETSSKFKECMMRPFEY